MTYRAPILMFALILLTVGYLGSITEASAAAVSPMQEARQQSAAPDLTGNWQISWTGKNGSDRQAALQIKQDGTKLTGTLQGERGSAPLKGSLQDNKVSFTVKVRRRQVDFAGSVDGDKMSGTTKQGAAWTATRQ